MASKEQKAIKKLKKQLKKLKTRVKKMHMEIADLQAVTDNSSAQLEDDLHTQQQLADREDPKFSAAEVETANELTDDAEEIADILEKSD